MKKLILLLIVLYTSLYSQEWAINQIGYDINGSKKAVIFSESNNVSETQFEIISGSKAIYTGDISTLKQVNGWDGRYFWEVNFSDFDIEGDFSLKISNTNISSKKFSIQKNILHDKLFESQVSYFNGMRNTLTSHKTVKKYGDTSSKTYDVYGGWSDASGDFGKYLSHQSNANYINPQQIPMVSWALLNSYDKLSNEERVGNTTLKSEAVWGTDYLLRVLDEENYFYITIFDGWSYNPPFHITAWETDAGTKTQNYQAAFREGAGLSIASLAKAAYLDISGDSSSTQYLNGAIRAYDHLKTYNKEYCDDNKENMIDDYTSLMACIELYRATQQKTYLEDAKVRVTNIINRQHIDGWFYTDNSKKRPFFHAAEEGLASLSLIEFTEIDNSLDAEIETTIIKNINWYINAATSVNNPFNYARTMTKATDASAKTTFFYPHENETGYWWQGDNARLASLSSLFYKASTKYDGNIDFDINKTLGLAKSQLDWILGLNPYSICMVYGKGYTNYPHYKDGDVMANIEGGICNGITAKDSNEDNIDFKPYTDNSWQNWRWIEQWLPHNAWFTIALTNNKEYNNRPSTSIKKKGTEISEITIYPNPFSRTLNISCYETSYEINIFNIHGELMISKKDTKTIRIPHALKKGVYKIKITTPRSEKVFTRIKI